MPDDAMLKEADRFFRTEQFIEAKKIYETIINIVDDFDAVYNYGICLVRLKLFEKAMDVFELIVYKYPDSVDGWYSLGRTYLILGDVDKAIDCLETSKKLTPDDEDIHFFLGMCYEQKKNFSKAINCYLQSIELEDSYETRLYVGLCYLDLGDLSSALNHICIAYNMDNNLDTLKYYAYVLIKSEQRKEAYELLLKTDLVYDNDCTILEILLLLSLFFENYSNASIMYFKLKSVAPTHPTVRDYMKLKKIAKEKIMDVLMC